MTMIFMNMDIMIYSGMRHRSVMHSHVWMENKHNQNEPMLETLITHVALPKSLLLSLKISLPKVKVIGLSIYTYLYY